MDSTETELIYSVREIFEHERFKNKVYLIPDYQRGYKWTPENVRLLLKDINEFEPANEDQFYYLQNITLSPQDGARYNVIDGQQRLTTIYILLCYLEESKLVEEKLKYAVRESTALYLQTDIFSRKCWEDGYSHEADHQDEYYIFQAAQTIGTWFKSFTEDELAVFKNKLLNHTKLIVNEVTGDEYQTFSNLNGVRIPLDASDLIRAILITYSVKVGKENVEIEPYRVKMGAEIDMFAVEWSDPELKRFFTQFLPEGLERKAKELRFDFTEHPINLLYLLFLLHYRGQSDIQNESQDTTSVPVNENNQERPEVSLADFEDYVKGNPKAFELIKDFDSDLQEWFRNPQLYHFLGYLIFNHKGKKDVSFKNIYSLWKRCPTRTSFLQSIKRLVAQSILSDFKPTDEEQSDGVTNREKLLSELRFGHEIDWYTSPNLSKILILNDILIVIRAESLKLNRLPVAYLRENKEDREHICCQTPNDKDLNNKKRWLDDLEELKDFKVEEERRGTFQTEMAKLKKKIEEADEITKDLKKEIIGSLTQFGLNSIGNLVLLNLSVNRGYGNSSFADKRLAIINNYFDNKTGDKKPVKSKNAFIRPYTLKTFLSNLDGDSPTSQKQSKSDWTMADIKANADAIANSVESFLNETL